MKIFSSIIIFFILLSHIVILPQSKESGNGFEIEVSKVGTSAATFLEIGVGARAMGMGGSYASVANDVSALYWNPAGIVWSDNMQVEIMHNEWLIGTSFDFLGVVIPMNSLNSSIGFSYTSLTMDEQPVRTVERPEGTGEKYDANDFAVGMTYALALTDRFSFGLTGKYISQRIWHEGGSAFAVDLGIFYNTELDGLRLGFSMSNFGTEIKLEGRNLDTTVDPDDRINNFDRVPARYTTDSYPLPLLFRAGISYDANLGGFGKALLSMDVMHPSDSPESINIGMEYSFLNMFFLRGGFENMFEKDKINGLTLGAGIDYYNNASGFGVRFDYAWADWGILDNAQRFSIGLVF